MTKSKVFASLLLACSPWLAMAQSDDLYFIPKKETKKAVKTETVRTVAEQTAPTATVQAPESAVVVRSADGSLRDVDEYNRRYTSRENTFSMQNDTLYIEEKPYGERGEWVNGFTGTQDDYEYAMRLVRFRNPRYAIPVSSPLYWDVVYALPSWDWNVYDDGFYAYVFPTYTNRLWWDWRWSHGWYGPGWGWDWHSPWYYSSWYSPYWYGGWYAGYWGGYWGGWYAPHHHHHWASNWGHSDIRPGRYQASYTRRGIGTSSSRVNGSSYTRSPQATRIAQDRGNAAARRSSIGRVVQGTNTRGNASSVNPGRSAVRNRGEATGSRVGTNSRTQGIYTRPSTGIDRSGSSYNRPSSTRRSVTNSRNSYNSNTRSNSSSYQRSSSSGSYQRSSSSGSFNRGSMGGGSSSRGSMGGGGGRSGGHRR